MFWSSYAEQQIETFSSFLGIHKGHLYSPKINDIQRLIALLKSLKLGYNFQSFHLEGDNVFEGDLHQYGMDCDPGILCMQHCGPRVFCLQLPEHCPACRSNLTSQEQSLVPFRVPYPFVRAHQHPCTVVIKPTNGDFLNDYKVNSDLHIAVTDSRGRVLEYDQHGLRRNQRDQWTQALVVSALAADEWADRWDHTLESVAAQDCWTPARYHPETFNCYTFVLSLLRCLRDGQLSEAAGSRERFCQAFVMPRATNACKYIALYRRLKDSGYYVSRPNSAAPK